MSKNIDKFNIDIENPDVAYITACIVGAYMDTMQELYPGFEYYSGESSKVLNGVDDGTYKLFADATIFVTAALERDMPIGSNRNRVVAKNKAINTRRIAKRTPLKIV